MLPHTRTLPGDSGMGTHEAGDSSACRDKGCNPSVQPKVVLPSPSGSVNTSMPQNSFSRLIFIIRDGCVDGKLAGVEQILAGKLVVGGGGFW